MLDRNVGGTGRIARIGFGSVLVFVGAVAALALRRPLVGTVVALVGGGLLLSGLARRCLVNELFGVDTTK